MIAVENRQIEIRQIAAACVTRLALLDTGMRAQTGTEKDVRPARFRLASEGLLEVILDLQLAA